MFLKLNKIKQFKIIIYLLNIVAIINLREEKHHIHIGDTAG